MAGVLPRELPRPFEALVTSTPESRGRLLAAQWGMAAAAFGLAGLVGVTTGEGPQGLLAMGATTGVVALLFLLLAGRLDDDLVVVLLLGGVVLVSAAALAGDALPTPVALFYACVAAQAWLLLPYGGAVLCSVSGLLLSGVLAPFLPFATGDAVVWWLATAAGLSVLSLLAAALRIRSDRLVRRLQALTDRDATTGVLNRHGLSTRLAMALADHRRSGAPAAVVLAELDGFDAVLDHHPLPVAEGLLRRFAACCDMELRGADALGRVGGERFALVLPGADTTLAAGVAERIRARLAEDLRDPDGGPVTACFGVAGAPADAPDTGGMVEAAGEALSAAKRTGADVVRTAAPAGAPVT